MTCVLKVYQSVVHTAQEDQVIGNPKRKNSDKTTSSVHEQEEKVMACHEKVESEDMGPPSITQAILRKSTDFLRRIIAPIGGVGGVTLSYVCPHCHCFPLEDYYIWRVSSGHCEKQCNWWCATCGGQYDWRASNRQCGSSRSKSISGTRCTARNV